MLLNTKGLLKLLTLKKVRKLHSNYSLHMKSLAVNVLLNKHTFVPVNLVFSLSVI